MIKHQSIQNAQDSTRNALLYSGKGQLSANPYASDHIIPSVDSGQEYQRNGTAHAPYSRSGLSMTGQQQSKLTEVVDSLEQYIQMGTTSLSGLQQQGTLLKGTHRRVMDIANVLGLSQTVIRWIDLRNRQDQYIFYGGICATFLVIFWIFYYIL